MKKLSISVTEAARNFADCVNRVRYQNVTFVLQKNGTTVAKLAPSDEKICLGSDLAAILAEAGLREEEVRAWRRDLQSSRKTLGEPGDRWQ